MTVHISIKGGLGNQLFQYAFGVYLKDKFKANVYYDTFPLGFEEKNLTKRKYTLDTSLQLTSLKTHNLFYSQKNNLITKFTKKIIRTLLNYNYLPEESFDINLLKKNHTYYLDGYWQNTKYAESISKTLNNQSNSYLNDNVTFKKIINTSNTVGIHIRRGDYVDNPVINNYHGNCGKEYFISAMSLIEKKIKVNTYFVFSDDINWAKKNLKSNTELIFVSENDPLTDLFLLKSCEHQIISNSSFSFWASYLNTNKQKYIIAPANWTKAIKTIDTKLYDKSWILI